MEDRDKIIDEIDTNNSPQKITVTDSSDPMDSGKNADVKQIDDKPVEAKDVDDIDKSNSENTHAYAAKPVEPQFELNGKSIKENSIAGGIEYVDRKKPKKRGLLKSVLLVVVIWVFFAAAGGAYVWRNNQANTELDGKNAEITNLQQSLKAAQDKLAAASSDSNTCTVKAPTASVIESIKASIVSGNTEALGGYMASSVTLVLAASQQSASYTPALAVSNITAFDADATSPWDFALSASVLSSYGQGSYAQYFPGTAVVGKSANKKVISFSFDCNAKIKTVLMSASESSLQ